MKQGWELKGLGEVCDVIGGGTPSKTKQSYYGGEIPWATVRDMRNEVLASTEHSITLEGLNNSSAKVIPSGEVIIATRVGLGKACLLQQDTAINQDLRGIIPKESVKLGRSYLHYWFKSIAGKIVDAGTGATVQGIKLPFIKSLEIPLPPLDEQSRIVALLDEAFAGLETARANAEANLKSIKEMFESYLEHKIQNTKPGYKLKKLSEVVDINPPKKQSKLKLEGDNLVSFVPMDRLNINSKHISENDDKKLDSVYTGYTYFENGDVLLAKITPCFENGKLGVASKLTNGVGFGSSEFIVLRPHSELIPDYLYYFLNRNSLRTFAANRMTGAVGHKRIPKELIAELDIDLPPIEEQRRIVAILDELRGETSSLKELYQIQLHNITELRQSLLEKAFAGELT